jgi:hypothetical protein
MLRRIRQYLFGSIFGLVSLAAAGQQLPTGPYGPVYAECFDQSRNQTYDLLPNMVTIQVGNPMNQAMAMRDPSGITFLRLPAANPMAQAFFVSWNMQLIELNVAVSGPIVIGECRFFGPVASPPQMLRFDTALAPGQGVINPQGNVLQVPQTILQNATGIAIPGMTTPAVANICMQESGGDKDAFANCMIPKMLTPAQSRAYQCVQESSGDNVEIASCLARQVVGENEARALSQATDCYKHYGNDFQKYPLCMAGQNFDPKTAATINCMSDQAKQGQLSAWSVAGCAAGNQLQMNPEMAIAVQCAMTTGGQPYAFAGCTAGQITTRELEKCFTDGIGGKGCFGENNDIIKALRAFGLNAENLTNGNGAVVNAWNTVTTDIRSGPGANNDIVRAVNTVNHDIQHGMGKNNDIRKFATKIGLGGLF